MQCPKCSQITFVAKEIFNNLMWRSQFALFYYFVESITKVKSKDFKVPKTESPWYCFQSAVYKLILQMLEKYYFFILTPGKDLCEVNDGQHHSNLQAEGYASFQVQVQDGTYVSYM